MINAKDTFNNIHVSSNAAFIDSPANILHEIKSMKTITPKKNYLSRLNSTKKRYQNKRLQKIIMMCVFRTRK